MMLSIKFVFCFLILVLVNVKCFSPNSIESDWSTFETAIQRRFNKLFSNQNLTKKVKKILDQNYEKNISQTCKTSILNLIVSLSGMELHAVQMFDASAKLPASGLLEGTVTNLGQYDECLSIKIPNKSVIDRSDHTGQYCTLRLQPSLPDRPLFNSIHDKVPQLTRVIKNTDQNHSEWLRHLANNAQYLYFTPIRLGICVTSACSSNELNLMMSYWFKINYGLVAKIDEHGCETLDKVNLTKKFDSKQYIACVILSAFGVLTLFGSLADALNLNSAYQSAIMLTNRLATRSISITGNSVDNQKENSLIATGNKFFNFLNCFSIQRNLPLIVDQSNSGSDKSTFTIDVIHGSIDSHFPSKLSTYYRAVNFFFALSGLLTSFTLLMNRKKMYIMKCFSIAFVHRIFRLFPPYVGLICCTLLLSQIRSGPLWTETVQPVIENCQKSYWVNLIFLNNFINTRQMCLMHTWYLSIDIQFYLIGLVVSFIFLRNKLFAFLLVLLFGLVATVFCAIVTYQNNYPPTILANAPAVTERWNYILDFYYKPWCHLSSYFIGFYFGYALYLIHTGEEKSWLYKIYSNAIFRCITSLFMASLGILTVFSIWPWNSGLKVPQLLTSVYASTFRFCWSLSIMWFIYVMTIERSGSMYRFFSWPGWLPISRITYSAYLFHPLVIWIHFGTLEHSLSYNNIEFMRMFVANLTLSLLLALISSLIFESPFFALQKIIFQNNCKNTLSKSRNEISLTTT